MYDLGRDAERAFTSAELVRAFSRFMVNWGIPTAKVKSGGRRRSWLWAVWAVTISVGLTAAARAEAAPCGTPGNNEIVVRELPGWDPGSQWDVSGAGSAEIQGFATDISANAGSTMHSRSTRLRAYRLEIYRMGYYGGEGRGWSTTGHAVGLVAAEPAGVRDRLTRAGWSIAATGRCRRRGPIPATAVSGVYFAQVVRDRRGSVRATSCSSSATTAAARDVLFQTSDTTWQAYNQYGGNSLYVGGPGIDPGRAYKVSYNRPVTTRGRRRRRTWSSTPSTR